MNNYRCVKCYFPRAKTTRDCDTVTFYPPNIPFPAVKLKDHLRQTANDVIIILTQLPSTTTPSLEASDPVSNALVTLATQLKRIEHIPVTHPSYHTSSPRVEPPTLKQ